MVGQSEREELLVELVKRELLDIIIEADEDKDGLMSHAEFLRILETPEGLRALETVGVDPVGLIDYADTIFSQDDGTVGDTILFSHFMNEVLQLRGSNTATVKDLINMRKFVEKNSKEVRKDVSQLSEQVRQLEVAIKAERGGPRHMAEPLRVAAMAKPRLPEQPNQARDMSPVPLVAHMPSKPRRVQNAPALPNMVNQVAEGDRSPELDGSVPQKLVEMQDILNELLSGPDAGRGRPRVPKWRQTSRGDSDEAAGHDGSPVRAMRVVHGRPVPAEELPRGRMVQGSRTRRGSSVVEAEV